MSTKTKPTSFSDYKAIKDDIIEISEQRFEKKMILKFNSIEKKINSVDRKIDSVDTRIDSIERNMETRFDAIEKRLTFLTWFLPILLTLGIAIFGFLK